MNGKIIAVASVGLIVGLALGILIGVFILPALTGNTGLLESDYTRITVFSDNTASEKFGDYTYIFFYKYDSDDTRFSDIVVEVRGIYEGVPSVVGGTYTVLDLRIIVSELHDDYVVLLVKPAV